MGRWSGRTPGSGRTRGSGRIGFNVSAGTVQFIGVADNAFVIIALPQSSGEWWPSVVLDGTDVGVGGYNTP